MNLNSSPDKRSLSFGFKMSSLSVLKMVPKAIFKYMFCVCEKFVGKRLKKSQNSLKKNVELQ